MNMKIKKTLAAVLAAFAILNIAGCSEKQTENNSPDISGNSGNSDPVISNVDVPNDSKSGSDTSSDSESGSDTSSDSESSSGTSSEDSSSSDTSKDDPEPVKTTYDPIELTDSNTLNSIRLFDAISEDKENAMFSPLSLNMALGLIEAGAKGDTKAALDSYLRTRDFADFAERYTKLAREKYTFFYENKYNDEYKYNNVLEIANSVWADKTLPLKPDYMQNVSTKFDAEIQNVDFANEDETLKMINGWVNDKTHEMIPKVLGNIGNDTLAVLVNTLYFESPWEDEWYVRRDVNDKETLETFTLPDGNTKEIPLMYNGGDAYFENDKATAFSCGYRNGLEFIGILPKDEGEFTLEGLDIPALLKSRTDKYDVSAVMPRLNFETDFELKDALSAAGLQEIFDAGKADFSGISEMELFVSEIIQKTKLELDENGTRAAAVTAILMDTATAMPDPKEQKTVRLDRPFAFMIYDQAEDQILFVGKVTNP